MDFHLSNNEIIDLVLCVVWSFSLSVFAIPPIIRVSYEKKLLDEPNSRTVHTDSTPRLGGLAIFAGFISAFTIFGTVTPSIQRMIASCLLLFFIGIKDDVIGVSAFKKFFIQCMAAGIIVFLADIRLTSLHGILGFNTLDDNLSYGLSLLTILMITNAINLLDGLDGLAGSISVLILSVLGINFLSLGTLSGTAYGLVSFSMVGGILGFLRYNFHKATVFMGDTGSLLLGFVISVLSVEFVEMGSYESMPALAIAILIVPIFDTLRVFSLRTIKGRSPFSPDKNHLHHVLLQFGLSQRQTVLVLSAFNIVVIVIIFYLHKVDVTLLLFSMLLFILIVSTILYLIRGNKHVRNNLHGA